MQRIVSVLLKPTNAGFDLGSWAKASGLEVSSQDPDYFTVEIRPERQS